MQVIKSGSSKWMHDKLRHELFEWQEKYGAFSIGISQVDATTRYIHNPKKHDEERSFDREWKAILKRHGLTEEDLPPLRTDLCLLPCSPIFRVQREISRPCGTNP